MGPRPLQGYCVLSKSIYSNRTINVLLKTVSKFSGLAGAIATITTRFMLSINIYLVRNHPLACLKVKWFIIVVKRKTYSNDVLRRYVCVYVRMCSIIV